MICTIYKYMCILFLFIWSNKFVLAQPQPIKNIDFKDSLINKVYKCYHMRKGMFNINKIVQITPQVIDIVEGKYFLPGFDTLPQITFTAPSHIKKRFKFFIRRDSNCIQLYIIPKKYKMLNDSIYYLNYYYYIEVFIFEDKTSMNAICIRVE